MSAGDIGTSVGHLSYALCRAQALNSTVSDLLDTVSLPGQPELIEAIGRASIMADLARDQLMKAAEHCDAIERAERAGRAS